MNFDVLLEGTMAGAELSALSEAEISVDFSAAKEATTRVAYVKALMTPFEDLLNNIERYTTEIKHIIVENEHTIHDNVEALNDAALKKVAAGFDQLGLKKPNANAIIRAQQDLMAYAKKFRNVVLNGMKNIKKLIEAEEKVAKKTISSSNNRYDIKTTGLGETKLGADLLNKKVYVKEITDNIAIVQKALNKLDTYVGANNKIVQDIKKFGVTLSKFPAFDNFLDGDTKKALNANVDAEESKFSKILEKLKTKFNGIMDKISAELNDPSIATVAVSVGVAIAMYLILYGVVKSSGGNVSSPANIKSTLTEGAKIVATGTIGKKLLVLTITIIFIGATGAAGKAGFNYIKKMISKK